MDVHDEHVPEETFGACLDALPQVCVEVLLEREAGLLVARRTKELDGRGEAFGTFYEDPQEMADFLASVLGDRMKEGEGGSSAN
jgi:hypothetical protein